MNQVLWTLVGFILGFGSNYAWQFYRLRRMQVRQPAETSLLVSGGRRSDDKGPDVDVTLVRESPVPRSVSIILILLGAVTIAVGAVSWVQRAQDQATQNRKSNQANEATCQLATQLLKSRNDGVAANAQLARTLSQIINGTSQAELFSALRDLQSYYDVRSKQAKQLPPLTAEEVQDCRDGVPDGD